MLENKEKSKKGEGVKMSIYLELTIVAGLIAGYVLLSFIIKYNNLKFAYKDLNEKYDQQEKQISEHQEETWRKEFKDKELEMKNEELLRMLKAILYNFPNREIETSETVEDKAKRGNIYIERDYMGFNKKIKLIFQENMIE